MELELKHLAKRLPYNLKCEILNYKYDYVGEKYGVINGYYLLDNIPYYTFKDRYTAGKTADSIMVLLRPLSDLTNEIEVNGIKFVPIERLTYAFGGHDIHYALGSVCLELHGAKSINIIDYPVKFMEKLLEWNFDTDNLIKNGLAIDINTVKK